MLCDTTLHSDTFAIVVHVEFIVHMLFFNL